MTGCAGPAPAAPARPPEPGPACELVRLTWAQPEDLVGHELRQAAEDGRDPAAALRAWLAAGGHPAPDRAGSSPTPAPPELRALAARLLDDLARLPPPSLADEPRSWPDITAACGTGPVPGTDGLPVVLPVVLPVPVAHPGEATAARSPGTTGAVPGAGNAPGHTGSPNPVEAPDPRGTAQATSTGPLPGHIPPRAAGAPPTEQEPHPRTDPETGPHTGPEAAPRTGPEAALRTRLEAAWLGRAVGCLLGKPVEKLPLEGIRALARAAGNWPLNDWFGERGVPPELLAAHPWNRRSAPTSLAENIDGMPEDDDLNYPLLGLLLLQRHGKGFTTADVARLWLDELPAGRTFTAERVAYRNLLLGLEPPPPPPTTTPSASGSAPSSAPTSTAGPTRATRPPPRPRPTGTPP